VNWGAAQIRREAAKAPPSREDRAVANDIEVLFKLEDEALSL